MKTSIFKVEYRVTEKTNGSTPAVRRNCINVAAKDAEEAIKKAREWSKTPHTYRDDVANKKITITKHEFQPMSVLHLAYSDL
jgi:hypothetical protein